MSLTNVLNIADPYFKNAAGNPSRWEPCRSRCNSCNTPTFGTVQIFGRGVITFKLNMKRCLVTRFEIQQKMALFADIQVTLLSTRERTSINVEAFAAWNFVFFFDWRLSTTNAMSDVFKAHTSKKFYANVSSFVTKSSLYLLICVAYDVEMCCYF